MVELKNISFRYSNTDSPAIRNLDLTIGSGECVLLCGESGCGKTTVTRLINGLIPNYYEGELNGSVSVKGHSVADTSLTELSAVVGSVFQDPRSQFFCVDTDSEIAFGPENQGLPAEEIRQRVDRAAKETGVEALLGKNIFALSGGEKQKIACASVSSLEPSVFVLDEPTSNLDQEAIRRLREILDLWKSQGKTVIIAEHRLSWLKGLCDRILYMKDGRIEAEFPGDEFFRKPQEEISALGLRSLGGGRDFLDGPTGFAAVNGKKDAADTGTIDFHGFRWSYGKKTALELEDLSVPEHAVVAVIGHNGAGKTTFSRCLCGMMKGFRGSVRIGGNTFRGKELRQLSYMVMQDVNHQLFTDSVREEVMLGMKEENPAAADAILKRLDLLPLAERHPMSLSGGQKQRVAIASAFLSDRKILVFDEPTSGLDRRHMEETASLICEVSQSKTVFIITHDMELVETCCTHILHIEKRSEEPLKGKKDNVMEVITEYAGSYRKLITLGRLLAALSALVAMIPFYELWKIIRIAVEGTDLQQIAPIAWAAVGYTVAGLLLYVAALMCTHISAFRIQANMRSKLMRRILTLPLGVFDAEGTGKIRRTVSESTAATETFIAHNLPDKAAAAATPVGLIILMLVFDWKLGLICMIPALIGFAFMMTMMGPKLQGKMAEYQNALDAMSSEAVEYVRGVPVVKTFGQTVYSFKRFKGLIDDYGKWATNYTLSLRKPMVGFITAINSIFVFLIAASYLFSRGSVTPQLILNVMYYIIITPLLTVTLTKLAYSGEQEMVVRDALGRIDSILSMEPLAEGTKTAAAEDPSIVLDHVSYRYEGAERDAVHDLSLRIGRGEHVAFVGPSGGGKTTTAELIARFFDVKEGSVRIGDTDVREITHDRLMELVSFVFQDSRLLKTSILENVRMSKPDASEEEVLDALHRAQCDDILEKLPDGIHTVLGAKGTYLSGGEQQRIAIARAILKNAPILILDEATAFADPDNEARMQAAFEELAKDKTMIMIAHRLSTVTDADRIFVLKDGECVESGTHEELLKRDGFYSKMASEYAKSVEWKVGA